MVRSISIILVSLSLLGSMMDLHDLAKLPRLIEHFQEHQNKVSGFSFFEFLSLHYGSEAERHDREEHEQHTGLPFKSGDCTYTHTITLLPPFHAPVVALHQATLRHANFYQSTFSSEFSQSIWQPPKQS
jgi:hypothetical protein